MSTEVKKALSINDILDAVRIAVKEEVAPLQTRVASLEESSAVGDLRSLHALEGKPMRLGRMITYDQGDKLAVSCPSCGLTQLDFPKIPTIEYKEKEKVIEKIPEGYHKLPEDWNGIKAVLDMKHSDGKTVYECPNCSKGLKEYLTSHKTDLQKIGVKVG